MTLGQVAYDAYYAFIGGKSVQREWENQVTPEERGAWEAIGQAVAGAIWDAVPDVPDDIDVDLEPLL